MAHGPHGDQLRRILAALKGQKVCKRPFDASTSSETHDLQSGRWLFSSSALGAVSLEAPAA